MKLLVRLIAAGVILLATATLLQAQVPLKINYQAAVRDASGNILANTTIGLRLSIHDGSATGTVVYSETHTVASNSQGMVNVVFGSGTPVTGTFSGVNWAVGSKFLQVEIDPAGGSSYSDIGTTELVSVPYALQALNVTNTDDADADPANELQTISKSGLTVTLSNGGGTFTDDVDDADADPANELQTITKSGNTVTLSNGGGSFTDDNTDADANPANELQTISLSGSILTLSQGGGSVTLPSSGGGDNWGTQAALTDATLSGNGTGTAPLAIAQQGATSGQLLKWSGTTWAPSADNVNDADANPSNELQTISKSGSTVSLSNGGGSFSDDVDDADASVTNELQSLSISGSTLSISSGNSVVIPAGTPAGSSGYIQYNTSGNFDAESNLFWDAINNRLGIVNSAPDRTLTVNGDLGVNHYIYHNNDPDNFYYFLPDQQTATVGGEMLLVLTEGTQDFVKLGDGGDVDINLNNNLFVEGLNGFVGIGTTTPTNALTIFPSSADIVFENGASCYLYWEEASATKIILGYSGTDFLLENNEIAGDIIIDPEGNLELNTDDILRLIIEADGDIGIGTSSPSRKLHVLESSTVSSEGIIHAEFTGSTNTDCYGVYGDVTPSTGGYGYGGFFDGGWMGVYGKVSPGTYSGTTYAVRGYAYGSNSGTKYGVYGYAGGVSGSNYGMYYSGNLAGTGTKSAIVRTTDGPKTVYCQESPENWFEDFGSATITNGKALVKVPNDYLQTVTINTTYPMKVFITPNANIGNWWVEKGEDSFTLYAPDAADGSAFDFRIVAKRKAYEDLRLKPAPDAYTDHNLYPDINDVPQEYRLEWVRLIPEEDRDPSWLNYLNEEQLKALTGN